MDVLYIYAMVSKIIFITDYFNIWADHKRKDLKFIITKQDKLKKDDFFPNNIIAGFHCYYMFYFLV